MVSAAIRGHEALTAYGLMQFTDMSQVRNVDKGHAGSHPHLALSTT
jgi:hypothetical protein